MAAQRLSDSELFNSYRKIDSVKELVELTKLSDDELYRTIGSAARNSMTSHGSDGAGEEALQPGDYTARKPSFFFEVKESKTSPTLYLDLPEDPTEAGRTVFDQVSGAFDKIMCRTVSESPLQGYKQESMSLGMQCMEALSREFPSMDRDILKAYVALRTKREFNSCNRW
ncbi:hypothetical protein LPW11_05360 [Geomonas sp. RF6]|uniref:hypothetical protein n=1 Tax=Geomonas sp. RF6 TaxID=2897342 RepID=UPI001E40938B|nr:hypothetical protein [Geomonas sp. RF6]UFS71624.1 hypothetical protein LPW11_05360 [Geomonas sp. RF6]